MAFDDDVHRVLKRTPILDLFEDQALRVLANVADTRRLKRNEVLFRRGERSDGGFAILSGSIEIGREDDRDDAGVILQPGALVGRTALFLRMQRPATATAREITSVMRISPTLMRRVLQQFPQAADRMSDWLAKDIDVMAGELEGLRAMFEGLDRGATAPALP